MFFSLKKIRALRIDPSKVIVILKMHKNGQCLEFGTCHLNDLPHFCLKTRFKSFLLTYKPTDAKPSSDSCSLIITHSSASYLPDAYLQKNTDTRIFCTLFFTSVCRESQAFPKFLRL